MDHKVKAILFDTRSIQKYIFSGNKLRTNIGASYIVDQVFETVLIKAVLEQSKLYSKHNFATWKDETLDFGKAICEEGYDCCIAYIGGGKALILFPIDENEEAQNQELRQIIATFSMLLLGAFPGLKTGAAIGTLDLSTPETYRATDDALHSQLKAYQNTIFPQVSPFNTGLTQICSVSGEVADYKDITHVIDKSPNGAARYYAKEVLSKATYAEEANANLVTKFKDKINNHSFPMELNLLGQKKTENYIAIVHIDGNNMGSRFMQCKTLQEQAELSRNVKAKTETAFGELLEHIATTYPTFENELNPKTVKKNLLPIRPIILGGDDVTFVCAAKFAISFTTQFISYMRQKSHGIDGIECCGGIAILSTNYPFFRGYTLAEQLCDAAKAKSRAKNDSWLDFAILHGEQAPTLDQIRQQEYTGARGGKGAMHFGPYSITDTASEYHIKRLTDCIKAFKTKNYNDGTGLAENKIKELRDILQHGPHAWEQYQEQLHHVKQRLPHIPGWEVYEEHLWDDKQTKTPYVDAIEMMDFYPAEVK